MMSEDHFTSVAEHYARFRPSYPDELFRWLASIAPQREFAWDCGAGNGQASIALSEHFELVTATDISAAQLASAPQRNNIKYRVAPAEASGIADHSVDLITIAQAMHWLDLSKFYTEVERVLKPRGVIATWGYNRLKLDHSELQKILDDFYEETIGAYWPPERVHVENGYRELPFSFRRLTVPVFALSAEWSREHLLGYLRSWSAVGRFQVAHNFDPVSMIATEVCAHWPQNEVRQIKWPIFIHAGHVD